MTYLLSGGNPEPSQASHIAFGSRRYDALMSSELNTIQRTDASLRLLSGPEVTKESFLTALHASSLFYYAGHSAFDMRNALQSSILPDGDKPPLKLTTSGLEKVLGRVKNRLVRQQQE